MPEPNLLEAMKAVEKAAERLDKRRRTPARQDSAIKATLELMQLADDYNVLAINHALEFVAAIRALLKVARAANLGSGFLLAEALREFQSGPYAGLLEGDD
jgi:hypothetical protein